MISNFQRRKFSHIKFVLLLTFLLDLQIEPQSSSSVYRQFFEDDLNFCPACFQNQSSTCQRFIEAVAYANEDDTPLHVLIKLLPKSTKRTTHLLQLKNHENKIVGKYLAKPQHKLDELKTRLTKSVLAEALRDVTRLDGMQFCPAASIERFVKFLNTQQAQKNELQTWLYMYVNVQPVLLPYLYASGFAVPQTYANCGFSTFQAYAGKPLLYYYNADFLLKIKIAKQLLEAAMKFSQGFADFRIYITDLTADNVVYNETTHQLYFVDLDTVFIVDAAAIAQTGTHKHVYIECDDCFAYSPQDICSYKLSDINLFAACQFLRENLRKERSKGFLYPLPVDIERAYPTLMPLLNTCVDCSENAMCQQRFAATLDLISLFQQILLQF